MPVLFILITLVLSIITFVTWRRLRDARRADTIRNFTLPQGLYQKLQQRHPDLTLKDCQLVSMGLRQFFMAYLKSGKKYVSMPSQVADDLWHEFILYTRNYEMFCQKAFGGFLHHTPAAVLGSAKQSNAGLRRCWQQVCRDELINPAKPTRLPLLFALDAKLGIANGFLYAADCRAPQLNRNPADASVIHCGADFMASSSSDGDGGGYDFGDSSDSDRSGDSGGSDGGGDSGGDSGGGCGGGGCGGGGD